MSAPLLNVRPVRFDVFINNDAGSGAHKDLATWRPRLEAGWYYLGPGANNGDSGGVDGVIVQETGSKRVLAPITDWELVWNDRGSGKPTDYALWRGFPAPEDRLDFICLGSYFVRSHNKPTVDESQGMRAVHRDALLTVIPGTEIWNDQGSGATADGAVWDVSTGGDGRAIGTGAFIAVVDYNNPPAETYALNRDKVNFIED